MLVAGRQVIGRREEPMAAFRNVLVGVATGLALITSAQAADYREDPYGEVETRYRTDVPEPLVDHEPGFRSEAEWIGRGPRFVEERHPRGPIPEWWRQPGRPVAMAPRWRHHEDCRLIIKRRVDPWGEIVVRRIRICD
jgi:hypothetical protein